MPAAHLHFIAVLLVLSAYHGKAGGYVDSHWTPQGSFDRNTIDSQPINQGKPSVPTLSYNYQPNRNRSQRKSSYYDSQPIVDVPMGQRQPTDSDGSRSKISTTGVFRTYGRGEVRVPYKGATFHVPRSSGSKKAHRASVTTRILSPGLNAVQEENGVVSRSRRDCASCPKDEIVVASRGNHYVLLPQPCSHRWNALSGPNPGSKLAEGVHYISGTLGRRKQICIYKFEVTVRRCPGYKGLDAEVSCSADNAWGSKCNFTCPPRKKLAGATAAECNDDLKWTAPEPVCIDNFNCLVPNIENGTKLNCQTNEVLDNNENYLPHGSLCKIKNNSKDISMRCKKGDWVVVRHGSGKKQHKKVKGARNRHRYSKACDPSPCLNGGTCLLSIVNTPEYVCLCKPSTEGPRCEYSKCETNICDNGGECLKINNQTSCFCAPNYTGDLCQLRIPNP